MDRPSQGSLHQAGSRQQVERSLPYSPAPHAHHWCPSAETLTLKARDKEEKSQPPCLHPTAEVERQMGEGRVQVLQTQQPYKDPLHTPHEEVKLQTVW